MDCIHMDKYGFCDRTWDFCVDGRCRQKEPMTNADRIRAMSDEELARFIANQRGKYCNFKDPSEEEYPKVLDWLRSPVEVDT